MPFKVIGYRQLVQILTMFMIVQFLGFALAVVSLSGSTIQTVQNTALFTSYSSLLFYIAYIAVLSLVLLMLFKFFSTSKIFKILEGFVVFISSFIVFTSLLSLLPYNWTFAVFGFEVPLAALLATACSAVLVVAKNKAPGLRNSTAIISATGAGLLFGFVFSFWIALLFMALLAVYDFIAVFITKHMLSLARVASDNNLALLISVNEVEGLPARRLSNDIVAKYRTDRGLRSRFLPLLGDKLVPVAARVELGTGDLSMPLMVSVSAAASTFSLSLSMFVIFGAVSGLLLTMFILRRYKRALPAIPPLLLGIVVFVLLHMAIFRL